MHLEATAVLFGLQDLGGKLTTGTHIGVILGPSLAILWVMLKLSGAMVGHVEAICQILFGHVVGFVSHSASPRSTKILSGFWRAMFYPLGGQMQGWKQHFGPRLGPIWPSWALLRYLEATAMLLRAKLGDLEGKLGYREVMQKDCVRPCCGFASRNTFPPTGPRF